MGGDLSSVQWILLALCTTSTSVLSGVMGMGGGMILMGVYATLLPVQEAMVLHGVTQAASNGFRTYLNRTHVVTSVLPAFIVGGLVALVGCAFLKFTPDKGVVFLALGAVPLIATVLASRVHLSVTRGATALVAGVLVVGVQLLAGSAGPLLDVFFLHGGLGRQQIVATKAAVQVFGHSLKFWYFGSALSGTATTLPWWSYPLVVVCAFTGTRIGKQFLDRMCDRMFYRGARVLLVCIAAVFIVRGVTLVL